MSVSFHRQVTTACYVEKAEPAPGRQAGTSKVRRTGLGLGVSHMFYRWLFLSGRYKILRKIGFKVDSLNSECKKVL